MGEGLWTVKKKKLDLKMGDSPWMQEPIKRATMGEVVEETKRVTMIELDVE